MGERDQQQGFRLAQTFSPYTSFLSDISRTYDTDTHKHLAVDKPISVFIQSSVYYDQSRVPDGKIIEDNGILRIANGRIILKKIEPLHNVHEVQMTLQITLVSEGDDKWADNVTYTADISHLHTLFEKGAYIGIWIDTWQKNGFKVDAEIALKEKEGSSKKNIILNRL